MLRKLFLSFGAIALAGLIGMAGAWAGTIVGSDHDLSSENLTTDQVCVFCHTPHNTADPATLPVPLWNRQAGAQVTYTMYSSPTIDMTIAALPQGVSAACLSCHDGITAFDALINTPPGFAADLEAMGAGDHAVGFGGDLTNDHPISITYNPSLDTGFVTAVGGKVGTLPLYRAPGASGDGNQVECASCHNVHDPDVDPFLRISNAASAVCTSCHIK